MNKKGFTTIELIVSFVMVVIILASLVGFTVNYRDRVKQEEVNSQLYDFKNTITKIIYDDIISLKYKSITPCVGQDNCVVFVAEDGTNHTLKVENICKNVDCNNKRPCALEDCGVYLVYDDVKYMLPDSDLNKYNKDLQGDNIGIKESASVLYKFTLKSYENSLYNLKMIFKHYKVADDIEIMLTIN